MNFYMICQYIKAWAITTFSFIKFDMLECIQPDGVVLVGENEELAKNVVLFEKRKDGSFLKGKLIFPDGTEVLTLEPFHEKSLTGVFTFYDATSEVFIHRNGEFWAMFSSYKGGVRHDWLSEIIVGHSYGVTPKTELPFMNGGYNAMKVLKSAVARNSSEMVVVIMLVEE